MRTFKFINVRGNERSGYNRKGAFPISRTRTRRTNSMIRTKIELPSSYQLIKLSYLTGVENILNSKTNWAGRNRIYNLFFLFYILLVNVSHRHDWNILTRHFLQWLCTLIFIITIIIIDTTRITVFYRLILAKVTIFFFLFTLCSQHLQCN